MPFRVVARLGEADLAVVQELLHDAVVGGHLHQNALGEEVAARVAEIAHQRPLSVEGDDDEGGAHAEA